MTDLPQVNYTGPRRRALPEDDWLIAHNMWRQGKDTLAIARALNVREPVVYNNLDKRIKW